MMGTGALIGAIGLAVVLAVAPLAEAATRTEVGQSKPVTQDGSSAARAKSEKLGPGGIYRGQGYARARRNLIGQGWMPVVTHFKDAGGDELRVQSGGRDLIKAGYKEIQYCAGTGEGACLFNFKKGHACLHVQTLGEYDPGKYDVVVNSWTSACPRADDSAWYP